MLQVKNISAFYGRIQVLHHVTFHVKKGEVVSLIGGNGAGKSTLLNVISGLHRPQKGSVLFQKKEIVGWAPEKIVRLGLVQVPEQRQLFNSLTVLENIQLGAYALSGKERRRSLTNHQHHVYQLFPILKERQHQRAGTLSGGEQQMLSIGRALMAAPQMLLLDEPSLGLAPLVIKEIFRVLEQLRQEGTSILLVEQNVYATLGISDRAYVMETGRILLEGTPQELLANHEVRRAFLGKEYRLYPF